jgi:hypothetical protein
MRLFQKGVRPPKITGSDPFLKQLNPLTPVKEPCYDFFFQRRTL